MEMQQILTRRQRTQSEIMHRDERSTMSIDMDRKAYTTFSWTGMTLKRPFISYNLEARRNMVVTGTSFFSDDKGFLLDSGDRVPRLNDFFELRNSGLGNYALSVESRKRVLTTELPATSQHLETLVANILSDTEQTAQTGNVKRMYADLISVYEQLDVPFLYLQNGLSRRAYTNMPKARILAEQQGYRFVKI